MSDCSRYHTTMKQPPNKEEAKGSVHLSTQDRLEPVQLTSTSHVLGEPVQPFLAAAAMRCPQMPW